MCETHVLNMKQQTVHILFLIPRILKFATKIVCKFPTLN